jgi:F5/8 type C domain/Domain of unknown function (DUF4073)
MKNVSRANIAYYFIKLLCLFTLLLAPIVMYYPTWNVAKAADIQQVGVNYSENIAKGKPVTVSSNYFGFKGSDAVDGVADYSSSWFAATGSNQWLALDLGKEYEINKWAYKFDQGYSVSSFKLQKSSNNIDWEDIESVVTPNYVTNNGINIYEKSFIIPFTARYVRILIENSIPLATISELELYTEGSQAVNDQPPTAAPALIGLAQVGETLTASSGYQDDDGDVEAGTTYAFYSYNEDGTNEIEVQAASSTNTYTIQPTDLGRLIKVKVVPENSKGTGVETISQSLIVAKAETPLEKINSAKAANNNEVMLSALANPELDLALPEGFENWGEDLKLSVAETVMYFFSEDYENKDQVQYVVDLAILPIITFNRTDLTSIGNNLNEFFTKLEQSGQMFPNHEEYKEISKIGNSYVTMSEVDKQIFSYRTKFYFTRDQLPIDQTFGTLTATFSTYKPINKVTKKVDMYNALVRLRLLQKESEEFIMFNPELMMDSFPLNFSKVDDPSFTFARYQELAQWMIDKRPSNGYTDYAAIQEAFIRFFAPGAPDVTGNDETNKLVGADSTMEYSSNSGTTWTSYDSRNTPTFNGNVSVLVRLKANGNTPAGEAVTILFTKNPPPPSNEEPTLSSNTEEIIVDVDGENGTNLTKTPIKRTTEPNGTVKDLVAMSESIAKDTVEKAKQQGVDTARIVIPDTNDKVSEITVEIPKSALKQLNDGKMKLEIATDNAIIAIPTESISTFNDDLYFRVVPLKTKEQQKQVEERAKKEEMIQEIAKNQNVQVLGRPMEIETNMQSREVSIILPLKDSLPADAKEREKILDNLAIFIEHSDGTKEVLQGKVISYKKNGELGLEFTVNKFSTFTIVYMDGAQAFFDGKETCGKDALSADTIGCVSAKKSVPVYELVNNRLKKVDTLNATHSVLAYEAISPMLGLGGDIWVERTNAIRYETPSKAMLAKNAGSKRVKQMWKGLELRPGQIGKVTVLQDTVVWEKINKTKKLPRILKKGEQYRVYRYVPGMYDLGNGKYVVQNENITLQ